MVGVLSNNEELNKRRLGISQLLKRRDLIDILGVPLQVIDEDSNKDNARYIVRGFFKSPLGGIIDSISMESDKATMFLKNARISGKYQDLPFIQESSHEYKFPDGSYYPLQLGKEGKVIHTETRTTTMIGKTRTESIKNEYHYKVERLEEITVPAGTFKCFKIVHYNNNGKAISTHYESDRVTQYEVKSIDHETGEVIELISLESGLTRSKESI